MFYVGYYRNDFDAYFESKYKGNSNLTDKYPTSIAKITANISANYKWISSTLYSIIYMAISVLIIFVLFAQPKIVFTTFIIYVSLFLMCFVLILIGNWIGSYKYGYGLAQNIKKLIQSPLLTFFIILYYWKIQKAS